MTEVEKMLREERDAAWAELAKVRAAAKIVLMDHAYAVAAARAYAEDEAAALEEMAHSSWHDSLDAAADLVDAIGLKPDERGEWERAFQIEKPVPSAKDSTKEPN
jgi:hypothetical protein